AGDRPVHVDLPGPVRPGLGHHVPGLPPGVPRHVRPVLHACRGLLEHRQAPPRGRHREGRRRGSPVDHPGGRIVTRPAHAPHPTPSQRIATMRRPVWLPLGRLLATSLVATTATAVAADVEIDTEDAPGYKALADLAVMDRGRIKPLHTLAIERVKL